MTTPYLKIILHLIVLIYIKRCNCFISSDSINDIKEIKTSTTTIIEYLQNWNNLYVNQVEPKISTSSVNIVNIDNNVKNLQERAHVWDTFQLHITAWNEILASIDRKLDILLTGQEKGFLTLNSKLSILNHYDYKIDTILENVTKLENVTNYQRDLIGNSNDILNELKSFDKKLNDYRLEENAKKCTTPTKMIIPKLESLVHDISSKVDVIFDSIANDKKIDINLADEEYMDDEEMAEEADDGENDFDVKLFKLLISRINRPCRLNNNILKMLTNKLQTVEENLIRLNSGTRKNDANNLSCDNVESLLQKFMDDVKKEIFKNFNTFNDVVKDHFVMQQEYLKDVLRNIGNAPSKNVENVNQKFSMFYTDKTSCDELDNSQKSGVYIFSKEDNEIDIMRYCEIRGDTKWTVIQRRGVQTGISFHRNWHEYQNGFGNLYEDFWFGNDFIHLVTSDKNKILRVELEAFDGKTAWAEYDMFVVDSEDEKYKLTIGKYKGNATDSLTSHNNSFFSTYDRKNDEAPECCPCAVSYGGGWWFNSCFESNLNGNYFNYPLQNNYQGLIWESWLGNVSLKQTKMMIRNRNEELRMDVDYYPDGLNNKSIINVTEIPYYEDP